MPVARAASSLDGVSWVDIRSSASHLPKQSRALRSGRGASRCGTSGRRLARSLGGGRGVRGSRTGLLLGLGGGRGARGNGGARRRRTGGALTRHVGDLNVGNGDSRGIGKSVS